MDVNSFLETLGSLTTSAKKKTFENKKLIQKIYCNFKGNFGKYQILPFNSVISNFPYVTLMGTREINIPRKNIAADGTESSYSAWIRILPASAYTIKDPSSGRPVSSLTAQDDALLRQAYAVWDELYTEVDGRNNAIDPVISKLIRRKNYTIFHGYCINYFAEGEPRKPAKQNFSGLFVLTAKNFTDIVQSNIIDTNIMNGTADKDWVNDIYSRDLTGRKGFMMLSVADNPAGPGFNISVNHQLNPNFLQGVTIPEEDAAEMENPVESFLGWQARSDEDTPSDQRKLFNPALLKETIEFMTDQLARIRLAKQNGTSIEEAIEATNQLILNKQEPTNSRGQATNDPILAQLNEKKAEESNVGTYGNTNVGTVNVITQNTDPIRNPAASHQDPITGTSAPFNVPSSFAMGMNEGDLPF